MTATPTPRHRLIAAGAANLLPVLGMLILGWNAAGVVFLLWLDALLGILELTVIVAVLVHLQMSKEEPADKHRRARIVGGAIGVTIGAIALTAPAMLPALGLHALLERVYPEGMLRAIFSDPTILPAAGLAIAIRAIQAVVRFKNEGPGTFRSAVESRYHLLLHRCVIMFALAFLVRPLGRYGLIGFVALASAVLFWIEIHEDRFLQFFKRMNPSGPAAGKPSAPG